MLFPPPVLHFRKIFAGSSNTELAFPLRVKKFIKQRRSRTRCHSFLFFVAASGTSGTLVGYLMPPKTWPTGGSICGTGKHNPTSCIRDQCCQLHQSVFGMAVCQSKSEYDLMQACIDINACFHRLAGRHGQQVELKGQGIWKREENVAGATLTASKTRVFRGRQLTMLACMMGC